MSTNRENRMPGAAPGAWMTVMGRPDRVAIELDPTHAPRRLDR